MRQSPSLLALLTVSATLGFASHARGSSLPTLPQTPDTLAVSVAQLLESADETAAEALATQPGGETVAATSVSPAVAHLEPIRIQPETEQRVDAAHGAAAENDPDTVLAPDEGLEAAPPDPMTSATPFVTVYELSQQPEGENEILEADPETAPNTDTPTIPDTPATPPAAADGPSTDEDVPESPVEATESDTSDEAPQVGEEAPETDAEETESDTFDADESPDQDSTLETEETDEADQETQVLVAEVVVAAQGDEPLSEELEDTVYDAIDTQAGQTTTRSQLQQDINNIFATGFFANVRAFPADTPLGVQIRFVVDPNPILTRVDVDGGEVIPNTVVEDIFAPQYGEIINLLDFQEGILALNNWYQENGFVLAQVVASPEITDDGVVTLQVAEGVIEDIEIRFLTEDGLAEDDEGNPIRGKTREFIITREFETEPGDVFQQSQIQADLQRAFGLGIFDDINLTLDPGKQDPRKVNVTVNVIERSTGSVAAGAGFNFTGDIFGTLSYRQDNFGGNNQKFSAETQLSTSDLLFDISFTDPWIAGDPFGTSYTVNAFARRSLSLVFDGGDNEVELENGDDIRINRFGGGVSFRRPFNDIWEASLGTRYQRVQTTDEDGEIFEEDELGNPLSASGTGSDDLWTVQFGIVRDLRNDPFSPTRGSVIRLGTEQSIPLGRGNILLNRLRGSYSQYIPVSLINFNDGPQALAFNIQGGTILGDLPPYEAFALGGTNSVRGFDEGDLASGRSFLQASVEYRFPLFSFLGAALFVDAGTDLGTGDNVPGSPGPVRDKPGSGFGYGAGVRVQTPLGPIRIDYGISDEGEGQLHFGIGERF